MAFTNTAWGGRRTAWHDAINAKDLQKLEWLIKKWPDDIEISGGQHGESPLMWACYKPPPTGFPEGVRLLLQNDAEVNSQWETMKSPLMFAAQFNHGDIADTLLEFGADPTLVNPITGKDAAGWAAGAGFKELGLELQAKTEDYRVKVLGQSPGQQVKALRGPENGNEFKPEHVFKH